MIDEADQLEFPGLVAMTGAELTDFIKEGSVAVNWLDESIPATKEALRGMLGLRDRVKKAVAVATLVLNKGGAAKPYVNGVTTMPRQKQTKKRGNEPVAKWIVFNAKEGISFEDLVVQTAAALPGNREDSIRTQIRRLLDAKLLHRWGSTLIGWPPGQEAPTKPKQLP